MVGVLDAVVSIGGLIIPPVFDFIKKKFVKAEADTPERTVGSLATTDKAEVIPPYLNAIAGLREMEIKYFNRDVIGTVSQGVADLRASIRPVAVIIAFLILASMAGLSLSDNMTGVSGEAANTLTGVRLSCEAIVSSWFGDRIKIS